VAEGAESYLAIGVQVFDRGEILCVQDIDRVVRSSNKKVLLVNFTKQAALVIFEVVSLVDLLEGCGCVQAFSDLAEPLCVHSFLVILVEELV